MGPRPGATVATEDDEWKSSLAVVMSRLQIGYARSRTTVAGPEEGARLIQSFTQIRNPAVRTAIIEFVNVVAKAKGDMA